MSYTTKSLFKSYNKDEIAAVLIPTLVMVFAQTHFMPLIVITLFLSLIYIKKPFVLYPAMFVTSLNTNYFMIVPGLSYGLIFTFLLIFSLLISKTSPYHTNANKIFPWIIILIIFNLVRSILSITGSMDTFFIMAENLVLLFLLSRQRLSNIQSFTKVLTVTSIVCISIFFWIYFTGQFTETYSGRYTIEGVNENRMAITYGQLSIVLFFSFFYYKSKVDKIICILSFSLAIFLLLLSGSRSAFFGIVMGSFAVVVSFQLSAGNFKKKIFPLILMGITLYVGIQYLIDSDLPVLERFQYENIVEGRGTHRIDRRDYLLNNVFPEHPFLGIGLGGDNEYAISPGPCHNIIFDPLIQIGLVGIFLYWYFISTLLWKVPRLIKNHTMIILPVSLFITSFINGMGEVVFFEKFFWNSIAMCVLFANNLPSNERLNKKNLLSQ